MSDYGQPQYTSSQYQAPKPKKTARNILIGVGVVIVAMVGLGAALSAPAKAPTAVTSHAGTPVDNGPTPDPVITPTNKPVAPTAEPTLPAVTEPAMTASQEQAIGSAESYLSFTAFSRKGLIQQLSSGAGEGFSVADATYAVDHVTVDWNEQAAKSALSYLQMEHFSRSGLIQQLESAYGEGFTHEQAVYGVTKAGL